METCKKIIIHIIKAIIFLFVNLLSKYKPFVNLGIGIGIGIRTGIGTDITNAIISRSIWPMDRNLSRVVT